MTATVDLRPTIVVVSSASAFIHLIQTLLDSLGFAVRTASEYRSVPGLVQRLQPRLVILDLLPWQEEPCWLTLAAIKAHHRTSSVPVLVCPVAGWLLAGHESLLALPGVHVWPEGFQLEDLLRTVQLALTPTLVSSGGCP